MKKLLPILLFALGCVSARAGNANDVVIVQANATTGNAYIQTINPGTPNSILGVNNVGKVSIVQRDYYPEDAPFFAKGDGVTDDSVAIQNCINYVFAHGGGVIHFSSKVYVCTGLVWPTGANFPITLLGTVVGRMFSPGSPTITTSPAYTVFRSPAAPAPNAGGIILTINGTGSGNQCLYANVRNICFEGPNLSSALSSTNMGIQMGEFAQWSNIYNCTFAFFGDQAAQFNGIDCTIEHCYAVYNLRRQPRTRVSGAVEVYGTDIHLNHNEFSGIQVAETAMTDPTLLYNNALLLQCAQSFIDDDICEGADAGVVMVGQVNASTLPGGLSYPDSCIGNTITRLRASNNWGNGVVMVRLNSTSPQNNVLSGCVAANNGYDSTSVRTSILFNIPTTVYDADFILNGNGNILANTELSSGLTQSYYGIGVTDQSTLASGLNIIRNVKTQGSVYSLGLYMNTGGTNATAGTSCDVGATGITSQTISGNALDITGASEIEVLDPAPTTISSIITTENQGTAWSGATAYVSGNVASTAGVGYICVLANTNQSQPNATYWRALNPFPRYGQRVRIHSQHGNLTITTAAVSTPNGRPIYLSTPQSYVDITLMNSSSGSQYSWTSDTNGTTSLSEATLSDASSTVSVALLGTDVPQNMSLTLTQSSTLAYTNLTAGACGNLRVIQGGSGSYTLALPANSRVNGSTTTVTLLTSIGAENILSWYSPDGTNIRWTVGTY